MSTAIAWRPSEPPGRPAPPERLAASRPRPGGPVPPRSSSRGRGGPAAGRSARPPDGPCRIRPGIGPLLLPVAGRAIPLPSTSSRRTAARNAGPILLPRRRRSARWTSRRCARRAAPRLATGFGPVACGPASSLASCRGRDLDRCRPHFESDRRVSGRREPLADRPRRAAMPALPPRLSSRFHGRFGPRASVRTRRRPRVALGCPASEAGLPPRSASRFHGGFGPRARVTVPRRLAAAIAGEDSTAASLPRSARGGPPNAGRSGERPASAPSSSAFSGGPSESIPKQIFGEAPPLLVARDLEPIARILVLAAGPPVASAPVARRRAIADGGRRRAAARRVRRPATPTAARARTTSSPHPGAAPAAAEASASALPASCARNAVGLPSTMIVQ